MGKNIGKIITKIKLVISVKRFMIVLKKSATDPLKTASKKAIQKMAEATGDIIGKKIVDKITSAKIFRNTERYRTL